MIRRPRALAPIREYADLGRALLARRIELDASRREIEAALGWPRGWLRAIEGNRKCLAEATAGPLLDLLGLQFVLFADGAPYVTCRTYGELIVGIETRRKQLKMTMEVLNDVSGLQEGYANKVIVGIRRLGNISLPAILGALRLALFIEPRPAYRWQAPEPPFFGSSRQSYIDLPSEIAA